MRYPTIFYALWVESQVQRLYLADKVENKIDCSILLYWLYFTFSTCTMAELKITIAEGTVSCIHNTVGDDLGKVTELRIDGTLKCVSECKMEPGCMPELLCLKMHVQSITIEQLEMFLAAAPKLDRLKITLVKNRENGEKLYNLIEQTKITSLMIQNDPVEISAPKLLKMLTDTRQVSYFNICDADYYHSDEYKTLMYLAMCYEGDDVVHKFQSCITTFPSINLIHAMTYKKEQNEGFPICAVVTVLSSKEDDAGIELLRGLANTALPIELLAVDMTKCDDYTNTMLLVMSLLDELVDINQELKPLTKSLALLSIC
jgi:hypothetical protein